MDTSQNHSPFFSRTATRARRQMNFEVEPQHLYDEFMGILDIALNDASRAGVMMQEIAHRELHPPGGTPIRNQQRNNNRITPYSAERRPSNRFGYSNPPQGMFDTRKNLFNAPVTPTRPLQYFSPATLSCSTNSSTLSKAPQQSTEFPHPATQSRSTDSFTSSSYNFNPATFSRSVDSHTPTPSPQRSSLLPLPATVSRVHNLPDFQSLHTKPCLRVILSETSIVSLSRPVHCVFNEETREWIIADKDRGIVFLNNDCFYILRSITEFEEPCAVALLNNGHLLGVLDRNGIFIYDQFSGEKRLIFSQPDCRGLAVSVTGDFVTVNYKLRYIFIVPQNGDTPTYFGYEPLILYNSEGLPSSASYINVSANRLVVVDYTIGAFNLYRFDPYKRELNLMVQQNCMNGVAQCRLIGGFMDQKGRIIVSNCKERICMLFDHDGKFLQRILCDDGFPRAQYICVNKDFCGVILETIKKPHTARLCRIVPDPDSVNNFPVSMHPRPVYIQTNSTLNSSAASSVGVSPQQSVSSIHYLEPNEVEENLVECKSLINDINLNDAEDSDIEIVEID